MTLAAGAPQRGPTFAELFTPKLVTIVREGYGLGDLKADAIAGLTVAVVALPLSMAIAIGSGLTPEKGLFTAIIGGFIISAFGGSRFQIGGPAGAFIVLISSIVARQGYDGLVIATLMAGVMMLAIGFLQLGTYIKYIPFPVTVGFTAGIAVIIFASQIKELLGLDIAKEPAELFHKLIAIGEHISTAKPVTLALSALSIALIVGLRRWKPKWPTLLISVAIASAVTAAFHLDVATVGTRFGGVPSTLPAPSLPAISLARMQQLLPDALAIALLGAIESLLSAVVADGMTGRRHRSNCELVAQGGANIASVIFGGMCATGTIARTATNVRAGARGPVSGMLHAVYVLLFMAVAAPLASYIPLAALGAVLAVVSWDMAEKHEFGSLLRAGRGDAAVLLATFLLTIFADLIIAIAAGVTMGAFLFLDRMAKAIEIDTGAQVVPRDQADDVGITRSVYEPEGSGGGVVVYRITGAFFFGATATVGAVLDGISQLPRAFILDFENVPLVDSSAAKVLRSTVTKLGRAGTTVYFTGAKPGVRAVLLKAGLRQPDVHYLPHVADAEAAAKAAIEADAPGSPASA